MNNPRTFTANESKLQELEGRTLPMVEGLILQGVATPFAKGLVLSDIRECRRKRESLLKNGVVMRG